MLHLHSFQWMAIGPTGESGANAASRATKDQRFEIARAQIRRRSVTGGSATDSVPRSDTVINIRVRVSMIHGWRSTFYH